MPLKALINGQEVVSILTTDAEWAQIIELQRHSRDQVRMLSGAHAIGKTSSLGTRFFAHRRGEAPTNTAPESAQHLELKATIARTAVGAGWDADVESIGDGWIADVLVSRGERRIAFEVQWSSQTDVDFRDRTARYSRNGIESVWLRRVTPRGSLWQREPNVFAVPAAKDAEVADLFVEVTSADGDRFTVSVGDFVTDVLDRLIAPIGPGVHSWVENCWKCRQPYTAWAVDGEKSEPEVRTFARRAAPLVRPLSPNTPLAQVGPKWSRTAGLQYDALSCPRCGGLCGDYFIHAEILPDSRPFTRLPACQDDRWYAITELDDNNIPVAAAADASANIEEAVTIRQGRQAVEAFLEVVRGRTRP